MKKTQYKPYPQYKPSGIEWIGEIPKGWEVRRLKIISRFLYGKSLSENGRVDDGVPVYGSNGVVGYHNKAITSAPCIVIGRKGSFGKINYSNLCCFPIDTTFYIDQTATNEDLKWLYYLLYTLKLDEGNEDSAVPGLNRGKVYERIAPLPPHSEQKDIADFLDRKTTQINDIVEKQKRMIALLKEKRSALITQVVTKGLDPKAKMKDSGVEWIGEIPEGWEVRRLKWSLLPGKEGMRIGPFGSSLKLDIMVEAGIKVYGQENVIASDYTLGKRKVTFDKYQEMRVYEVNPRDILLSMMGSTGNFSIVPDNIEKGIIDSHLLRIRFQKTLSPQYFIYLSNYSTSITQQIDAIGKGSIMQGLNSKLVRQLLLPLPPFREQLAIADFLDREMVKIDTMVGKIEKQIELLNEYKQSLITHVVTGKIDVRG